MTDHIETFKAAANLADTPFRLVPAYTAGGYLLTLYEMFETPATLPGESEDPGYITTAMQHLGTAIQQHIARIFPNGVDHVDELEPIKLVKLPAHPTPAVTSYLLLWTGYLYPVK